MYVPGKKM